MAAKRAKKPSRFIVSPYINKKTATKGNAVHDEMMICSYLFSMEGSEFDFIFETKEGNATIRDYMQTLAPTLKIESNVIDTYCLVLNHEQGVNSKGKKTKHFFHTGMITKDMFNWKMEDGKKYDEVKQYKAFSDTMKNEFKKEEVKKLKDLEMGTTVIIDNSKTPMSYEAKYKKVCDVLLDRIMANMAFISEFVGVNAVFKPYRNSDHSPSILSVPTAVQGKPKPFKFYNIITKHERFREIVQGTWCNEVSWFFMFRIVKKLKSMKKPLRKLLFEKGNLHANVDRLRVELDQIQTLLDKDPFNSIFCEKEATCVVAFNQAILEEERFLKQKAKIHWLKEGDSNSAYFHKAFKSRVSRSRIDVVTNGDGILFENENVPSAFVNHYEAFLGQAADNDGFNDTNLFKNCLEEQEALFMVRCISDREVKEALFSMGDDKSPG
ncbi:hypothetical protein Tco_1441566, partial [Tanacetum coccineum]